MSSSIRGYAATLEAANVSYKTIFNQAWDAAPTRASELAMIVRSQAATENYAWLGGVPTVKEWISDRSFQKLKAYKYQIENKDWEGGISVDRNDLEDDRLGMVPPRIRDLARRARTHYDTLLWSLLSGGFTGLAYDGQYFFDNDHPLEDGTTQSNHATAALADTSYDAGIAAMMGLKADNGEILSVTPTHLVVPPALRATATSLIKARTLANGADNPRYGEVEVIVEPRLTATSTTAWFLLDLSKEVKPFILQIRRDFEFHAHDDANTDEQAFMRKLYRYSVDGRHNAGYGLWQLAYGSTGAS